MRLFFLILFFGLTTCFAQKKDSTDSLDVKVISQRELIEYLQRVNTIAMKQFDLTEGAKHQAILNELNAIIADVERKRKEKK